MKFGTLYSYWGTEWNCNYYDVMKKISDIGFEVLEIGADHVYRMEEKELERMEAYSREYGLTLTVNSGPPKEYDLASKDPAVRMCGIRYFCEILKRMKKIGSSSLAGAIYSFWPSDMADTDKEALWERSITSLKEISKTAEELEIEIALEVLNRYETCILTDCKEAVDYCRLVGSDKINILLDTYHMNIEEDDIIEAIRFAGSLLGHFHVGERNRKLPGMNNSLPWAEIGQVLRDINYQKAVVMEPFLLKGGAVGYDIRVWRDLSNQADEARMDQYISDSLKFLRKKFLG